MNEKLLSKLEVPTNLRLKTVLSSVFARLSDRSASVIFLKGCLRLIPLLDVATCRTVSQLVLLIRYSISIFRLIFLSFTSRTVSLAFPSHIIQVHYKGFVKGY